jgi:hypothetical protein
MIHNRVVETFEFVIMFNQNLESSTKLLRQLTNTDKPLPYRQPEIYSLGSLEQIQARYQGSAMDGPNASYWWTPSSN